MLIYRHYEEKKLQGSAVLYMDHYVSPHFDFCTWEYCYSNSIFAIAIPKMISSGQRAFNLGIMSRYAELMLFFIHNT